MADKKPIMFDELEGPVYSDGVVSPKPQVATGNEKPIMFSDLPGPIYSDTQNVPEEGTSAIRAGLQGVSQGLTSNLSDEGAAHLKAIAELVKGSPFPYSENKKQALNAIRREMSQTKAEHPTAFGTGQVLGAIGQMAGATKAVPALAPYLGGKGSTFGKSAAGGAVTGMLGGFGESLGETERQILMDTLAMGPVGATSGLVGQGVGNVVQKISKLPVVKKVSEWAGDKISQASDKLSQMAKAREEKLIGGLLGESGRAMASMGKIINVIDSMPPTLPPARPDEYASMLTRMADTLESVGEDYAEAASAGGLAKEAVMAGDSLASKASATIKAAKGASLGVVAKDKAAKLREQADFIRRAMDTPDAYTLDIDDILHHAKGAYEESIANIKAMPEYRYAAESIAGGYERLLPSLGTTHLSKQALLEEAISSSPRRIAEYEKNYGSLGGFLKGPLLQTAKTYGVPFIAGNALGAMSGAGPVGSFMAGIAGLATRPMGRRIGALAQHPVVTNAWAGGLQNAAYYVGGATGEAANVVTRNIMQQAMANTYGDKLAKIVSEEPNKLGPYGGALNMELQSGGKERLLAAHDMLMRSDQRYKTEINKLIAQGDVANKSAADAYKKISSSPQAREALKR